LPFLLLPFVGSFFHHWLKPVIFVLHPVAKFQVAFVFVADFYLVVDPFDFAVFDPGFADRHSVSDLDLDFFYLHSDLYPDLDFDPVFIVVLIIFEHKPGYILFPYPKDYFVKHVYRLQCSLLFSFD
jgi:hypothetical protein